jgi:predicted DNA-binding protein
MTPHINLDDRVTPLNLSVRLPPDVAELLRDVSYRTGRSKRFLVINALRKTYGPAAVE